MAVDDVAGGIVHCVSGPTRSSVTSELSVTVTTPLAAIAQMHSLTRVHFSAQRMHILLNELVGFGYKMGALR